MSKYLEKLQELVLLNPKDKSTYFSKMGDYKKAKEETQKAFDDNANTLFNLELNKISDYYYISTKYLKRLNLMATIIFSLFILSLIVQVVLFFLAKD